MFKLGGKNLIVLCLLIKIVSAVSSADRCNSKESEKAVWDLNWIGGDISSDTAHNSEHFSHFRFPIPVANWQFLIKVWTYVIGLSCLLRTMLEYQKVRQVWTLQYGTWKARTTERPSVTQFTWWLFGLYSPPLRRNSNDPQNAPATTRLLNFATPEFLGLTPKLKCVFSS